MSINSKIKRGRKPIPYVTSWGDPIVGLARRTSDGRWRVVGTAITFTESDERLAVARFEKIIAERSGSNLGKAVGHASAKEAFVDAMKRSAAAGGTLKVEESPPHLNAGAYVVTDNTLSTAQWAWLREQFISRPQWVAGRIGLEQLGWYSDFKRPTGSPTMAELIETYAAKAGLSSNEASRSKHFWKEFSKITGIKMIGELTHERVAAYEKLVAGGKYAPKSILHRYRKVRTILSYAIRRGVGIEHCRKALDITAMLEVKNHTPLDPRPLPPDQFWAIYKAALAADDATFATLMLMSLNLAMYGGEISAVKWTEIDLKTGMLVGRRPKTGVSRVGVLWPEVIAGLKKLERRGDYVFYSTRRSYNVNAVLKAWRGYRTGAKLDDDVVFSQIRDAAFTCACSVSLDQARVLAGHRLPGASDHYIRRSPQFVGDACKAIRVAYFQSAIKTRKR